MSEVKVQDKVKVQGKPGTRRKLIKKVKRNVKRETTRLAQAFGGLQYQPRSGLGSFMTNNTVEECDFEMSNQITMGEGRKLKRKLKKLQKKIPQNPEKVFKQMNKYKQSLYVGHQKKIFRSVNQLQKRRQKRRKRMDQNSKKQKAQIQQRHLDRFE